MQPKTQENEEADVVSTKYEERNQEEESSVGWAGGPLKPYERWYVHLVFVVDICVMSSVSDISTPCLPIHLHAVSVLCEVKQ